MKKMMKAKDVALALMSSALLLLSFPRFDVEALAWVALVPLLYSLKGKRVGAAFFLGWLFGLAFFMGQVYWLSSTLKVYGQISTAISLLSMLILAVYLSVYFALFASILGLCENKLGARGWLLVPFLWTTLEYARENAFFLGFPWGSLGYSQYQNLMLIQAVDITGVPGVTFAVALVNSAAAQSIFRLTAHQEGSSVRRRLLPPVLAAAIPLVTLYAYGSFRLSQVEGGNRAVESVRVAVVQGNIPQDRKWDSENDSYTLAKYGSLSRLASAGGPRLIIWPETAVPFFFQREGEGRSEILRLAREEKAYLLFGSPSYNDENGLVRYYNSAFLLSPGGEALGRYDKQRLVPFGEYVPMKWLFSFVNKIVEGQGEFSKGRDARLLSADSVPFGVLICFEVLFPGLARKEAQRGARYLVNITNDAWFGRTSAPYAHFSVGVFRAIENRMALVRAANTGISGFIAPSGRVLQSTAIFEDGWLVQNVPVAAGTPTAYIRFGDLFARGVLAFTMLALFLLWYGPAAAGFDDPA